MTVIKSYCIQKKNDMGEKISFSDIQNDFKDFKRNLADSVKMVAEDTLLEMQTTSKTPGYVPVKTGTLKRSITHSTNVQSNAKGDVQNIGAIGSNVEYARIQEFGGDTGRGHKTHIVGKFYITRAINNNMKNLEKRLAAIKFLKRK